MAKHYEVRFTVLLPDDAATDAEAMEWLRYCLHDTGSMKIANPLSPFEVQPVRGTFRAFRTAGVAPVEAPSNEELEALWERHAGHAADFAADVLERWGGWQKGVLGYGGTNGVKTPDGGQQ